MPSLPKRPLLIGTRGSPLALWQAEHVRRRLIAEHRLDQGAVELCPISTSGDRIADKPLRDFGGKGLFTKEIDEAELAGRVDIAVHSMKDLPALLPPGLMIGAVLKRGDVRDAFISAGGDTLSQLPQGAVVGSSSLRRQAQLKRLRPDLELIYLRGNVETRLAKLDKGVADATVLALAGLERLGLTHHVTAIMPVTEMLPAVAQGAIGVVCREDDAATRSLLEALNHAPTATAIACERAYLAELDGSCRTPIAGLAELDGGTLLFRGLVLKPDGSDWHAIESAGPASDAARIGAEAGRELLKRAGPHFLAGFGPR
jgi:hydroxymethylbilane synthase